MTENTDPTPPGLIPGSQPPAPPAAAPGMIPGAQGSATPPAPWQSPTPVGRDGYALTAPTSLSYALIGVSAAYLVISLILAAVAQQDLDVIRETIETGSLSGVSIGMVLSFLSFPLMVMSFVVYGLWAGRLRKNREAMGERPGLPAVEWWGWFVPFASAVLVPLGLFKVAGRKVSGLLIAGWMITYTVATGLSGAANLMTQLAVDLTTGELTRPEMLDSYVPLMVASAGVLLISWGLFYLVIRRATATTLEP